MATPTTDKHPRAARRPPAHDEERALTSLQQVIDDLDHVREQTGQELRRQIDSAVKRMRDVAGDLRERTDERSAGIERTVERAADEAWQQIALLAVRAQHDPKALTEIANEIRKRRTELLPPAKSTGTKAR